MTRHGDEGTPQLNVIYEEGETTPLVQMPPVPEEAFQFIEEALKAAQGLTMKTNDAEATLRKGNMPKSSDVTTVDKDSNKGLAAKLASANEDGNPKKRTCNSWGIKTPSCNK